MRVEICSGEEKIHFKKVSAFISGIEERYGLKTYVHTFRVLVMKRGTEILGVTKSTKDSGEENFKSEQHI